MAKAPASDAIMAIDKLKPLLALSKREPVNAAICLTADGEGIILLDKKAKPKSVAAMMRASAAKAKLQLNPASVRWGRAEVDTDYDPGMVRFFINKDAPSVLRVKLIDIVKKISYQKVELNVDTSIDAEAEEAQETQGEETTASAPDAEASAQAIPAAPPPPPGLDAATLRRTLVGLVGRINQVAGDDTARKAALAHLAGAANEALKGTDLEVTSAAIDKFREALDGQATGFPQGTEQVSPSQAPPPPPQVTSSQGASTGNNPQAAAFRRAWANAWNGWIGAIDTVEAQIDVLGRLLRATEDEGFQTIADSGLSTIFENHKVRLTGAGMRVLNSTDAALSKAIDNARKAVDALSGHIASSPKVAVCDEINLGVTVSIRATLTPALKSLSDALSDAPLLAEAA